MVNTDRLKEESSPFRYNYNRRSSIVSNSGSTVQNHSRSSRKQSISVRRGGISKELQSTPHMAVSGSGVQEEKEWNKIGSGSTEGMFYFSMKENILFL